MVNRLSFKEIGEISYKDLILGDMKKKRSRLIKEGSLSNKYKEAEEYFLKIVRYYESHQGSAELGLRTKRIIVKCKGCGQPISCTRNPGGSMDTWGRDRHYVESCKEGPHIEPLPKGSAKCSICGFKGTRGQVYTHRYNKQH